MSIYNNAHSILSTTKIRTHCYEISPLTSQRLPQPILHGVRQIGGNPAIDSGINRKPKEWVAQPRPQTHLPPLPTDRTERKPHCIKIPMHCRCFLCMWTMCSNSCKCCKVRKLCFCTETPVQNVRLNRVYRSLMCMNLWLGPSHNVTATILIPHSGIKGWSKKQE